MRFGSPHLRTIALALSAGAVAFGLALRNGFVWDDNYQIVRNPFLRASAPWKSLFFSDVWGYTRPGHPAGVSNYYRPLQMLTYRLTEALAGMRPAAFHAVNLAFHLLACVLVYAIFWQLTRRRGWAAAGALVFAVQPMHSEAVIWVSALTELGCALAFFGAFWLFLLARGEVPGGGTGPAPLREPLADARGSDGLRPSRHREGAAAGNTARQRSSRQTARIGWLAGSVLLLLMALFWKEMALTFPLVVGAWMICFAGEGCSWPRRAWDAFRATLPYWAVIAAYLAVRMNVLGFFSRVQQPWQLTRMQYVMSVIELVGKYWAKLLLPVRLNAFHVFHPVHSLWEPREWASILFLAAAVALILYGLRRAPLASFAAAWTLLTLIPVLALRQVGMNVFTERYLYIPSLGFCLLLVWAGAKLIEQWKLPGRRAEVAAVAAVALVATLYIVQDWRRIPEWKDDLTLYARTVRSSPDSALMHNSYGELLRDKAGDLDAAQRQYLLAIAVASAERPPEMLQISDAYVGLAGVYTARGQYDKALVAVNQSLKIDPNWAEARISHAVVLMHMGQPMGARIILLGVVRDDPNDEVVLNALGAIALTFKEYQLAAAYFHRALDVLPDYDDAFNNLGRVEAETGQFNQALADLQRAVALDPTNPVYCTNLGVVLGRMGRLKEARIETERALTLEPNYPPAQANLAKLIQMENKGGTADAPKPTKNDP